MDYATTAPHGLLLRSRANALTVDLPDRLGLNEVGVTDGVMAALWRVGPAAATVAVSSAAEASHVGADLAIVHSSTGRVLHYQSKLGYFDGPTIRLKSPVKSSQVRLLNRRSVVLDGRRFRVTGRLAIYQADNAPFINRGGHFGHGWWWDWSWMASQRSSWSLRPEVSRRYYEDVLIWGCSSSGILASSVAAVGPMKSVPASAAWPWEFDAYEWLRGASPVDDRVTTRADQGFVDRTPDFEPYRPVANDQGQFGNARELLQQLVTQLRLPLNRQLLLISM